VNIQDEHLEAIIVSMLAVNNFSLERAYGLLPTLRESGLTSPKRVIDTPTDTIRAGLATAGYQRGHLTEMFADRLIALMREVDAGRLDRIDSLVLSGKREEAQELLCSIRGIGPRVALHAWLLMTT